MVNLKKIKSKETDQGLYFYGEKGRYSYFGFYLVHLSVLLIILGGIMGSFFGFEAFAIALGLSLMYLIKRLDNPEKQNTFLNLIPGSSILDDLTY